MRVLELPRRCIDRNSGASFLDDVNSERLGPDVRPMTEYRKGYDVLDVALHEMKHRCGMNHLALGRRYTVKQVPFA